LSLVAVDSEDNTVLTRNRLLAAIGLVVGLLLVAVSIGAAVTRSRGSAADSGQTTKADPCRAGLSLEALYQTALSSQSPGHWDRAIACAEQDAKTNPGYKQLLFVEAWALWNSGRRIASIGVYRAYLQLHPEDAQGWLSLGYSLIVTKDCREAIPALDYVLRLKPANVAAVHNLVLCGDLADAYAAALHAENTGNFAAALAQAREVTVAHPDFRNILFLQAWAQWNLGQREPAIETYRIYLKSHSTDAQAQLNLGAALINVGRCSEAVASLQEVLKLELKNRAATYNLALCGVRPTQRPAMGTTAPMAKHTVATATAPTQR
jgi:tetratricopeptide (TPR) repeat protein